MKSIGRGFRPWKLVAFLVTPLLALMLAHSAVAGPGEGNALRAAAAADHNSLVQFKVVVGQVVLSEDACGTNAPACTVEIVKPSALATVREADLFCATTGFTGYMPLNGDVTVNGVPVTWAEIIPNAISSFNARSDVTSIVAPTANAAPPGLVVFTITETPTINYDGCILKVIWDDPTTTQNSILIFWGAQETTGDTFVINFAPLSPAALLTPLEFSLGISYGFQPGPQFSQVDVDGIRLTTSAGGQDDGEPENGALITVGGTGDTATNPPDPFAPPVTPNVPDDELYDLRPFVMAGDTSVTIFTLNPSNDDNIFIANLFLRNVQVITPPPPCPPDDDDDDGDDDGLTDENENRLLTLLSDSDSDDDGIVDGNDDSNGNGEDDEDEDDDDDDDECPDDDDEDDDGVDDEDEDDDEDDD